MLNREAVIRYVVSRRLHLGVCVPIAIVVFAMVLSSDIGDDTGRYVYIPFTTLGTSAETGTWATDSYGWACASLFAGCALVASMSALSMIRKPAPYTGPVPAWMIRPLCAPQFTMPGEVRKSGPSVGWTAPREHP